MTSRVLVTGASGFIGGNLCRALVTNGVSVRASRRDDDRSRSENSIEWCHGELNPDFSWAPLLSGIDVVVHCAGRVHMLRDTSRNPLEVFRAVNVAGTLNLARQAAADGVRRFIFLSSIGVNGAETFGTPFRPHDKESPVTPYATSKYEAERALRILATETGMELVIIRAPLVYGPGAPGNFARLIKWLGSGMPMPFAGITRNRRSLVFVGNIVDLIRTCMSHPAAANRVVLVADGENLSTEGLLRRMAYAMECSLRLFPVPVSILRSAFELIGRPQVARSLLGSLEVDIDETHALLDWVPPFSVDEGLRQTTSEWRQRASAGAK